MPNQLDGLTLNANALYTDLSIPKLWLGLDQDDTASDPLLTLLVNGLSDAIERRLNRKIVSQTLIEVYDSPRGRDLMLREFPVVSVTSIFLDDEELIEGDDFTVDLRLGRVRLGGSDPYYAWKHWDSMVVAGDGGRVTGFQNVTVTYVAGYATVPDCITLFAAEWLKYVYDRLKNGTVQATSVNLGALGSIAVQVGIPKDITHAVDLLKRVRV